MAIDKVVDSQVLDGYFEDIADSIRLKDGTQNTYTPSQMPQAIEDIPSGDQTEYIKFISGQDTGNDPANYNVVATLPDGITFINAYSFYQHRFAKVVVPASITRVSTFAFTQAFFKEFPQFKGEIEEVESSAFSTIRYAAGAEIKLSGSTTKPLTFLGGFVFSSSSYVEKIELGNQLWGIKTGYIANVCSNMSQLKEAIIYVNEITASTSSFFENCSGLEKVKMIMSTNSSTSQGLGNYFFRNCSSCLEYDFSEYTVIPRLTTTASFSGINANAKIVVPDDLYDDWIIETNWATYASYIVKASEYTPPNA